MSEKAEQAVRMDAELRFTVRCLGAEWTVVMPPPIEMADALEDLAVTSAMRGLDTSTIVRGYIDFARDNAARVEGPAGVDLRAEGWRKRVPAQVWRSVGQWMDQSSGRLAEPEVLTDAGKNV